MRACAPALLLVLIACSETLHVLGPHPALPPQPGDSGIVREPDDFDPIDRDAAALESPCERCAAGELCAVDACVPALGIRSIASSLVHSCEIEDGRLFCWGQNDDGQLGTGDRIAQSRRARVGTRNDWLSVSTGEEHTCAIRAPGQLFCWGDNGMGQLGVGDTQARMIATAVDSDVLYRSIACGGTSSCAIDEDDRLRCWGDNLEGKPGQGDAFSAFDITRPTLVGDARYAQVAVGQGHVCAIDAAGALFCWGRNTNGELGIGLDEGQLREPTRVGGETDWIDIAASQHSTCGVREDGSLWCWGGNAFMELAQPELDGTYPEPLEVGAGLDFADVETGWFHTCAIRRSGELRCWGRAIEGQLGQGGGDPIGTPTPLTGPAASSTWAQIALGNFHTCGATTDDALFCWGAADEGQLGQGDQERRFEPTALP